jgi:OPA family glycerol-3-phosphate transporter-like MFS transporter
MRGILRPAAATAPLPEEKAQAAYRRLRIQVFAGIFVGYAGYYLVRKNFSLAMPYLIDEGYSRTELGFALSGVSIAYGLSKLLMGSVSDRSNPRYFMALGLGLSACVMFVFGFAPFALSSVAAMAVLLLLNGWFQGMGWPACGRTMVHWFSVGERGMKMAVWNVAHNIGGGLVGPLFLVGLALTGGDWRSVFYLNAGCAVAIALFILVMVRDTPQSEGLPPIEEYRDDRAPHYDSETHEREMTTVEIFFTHVFRNRLLWYLAIANVFVYTVRYGVVDWVPTYLKEAKGHSVDTSSWAYFIYEWAGIPGTLVCAWLSDRVFKGKRGPASLVFMILVTAAVGVYWINPAGNPGVDMVALMAIGFLIYGPVMLIGLHALDLVPKKAAGTAAGLTGLFGYFGGAFAANIAIGAAVDHFGWDGGFWLLFGSCLMSVGLFALVWRMEGWRAAES